MSNKQIRVVLKVFLPFAAGYFLSYVFRVVNAVISTDLVSDIAIGPSELGLLTATYFIAFASFQLPLGILLDRFGPRKTESILLLFAAAGAFIFAQAHSLTGLIIGRAFIGFGVSSCLMAAFKAYTLWFPRERLPMINGFQMASGGLGALAATSPVEFMLGVTDWRTIFLVLAALTLVVAVVVWYIVPEKKRVTGGESLGGQLRGISEVFTSMQFWRVAPLTTMSQAAFLSIQGLWSGPWLRDVAGFDRSATASVLFMVAVAMICGFISLGSIAQRLDRTGVSVQATAVIGMSAFLLTQVVLVFGPPEWAGFVWLLFGFFGTAGILAYAALTQSFQVHLSGRVTTGINLLVFVTAFAAQWVIGAVIELWPISPDGSYSAPGYMAGFSLMLFAQAVALFWYVYAGRFVKKADAGD
ncbi:MAG: MFS transporter [Desulfocapsaceae bacterium]|jgi:MFS family permease|nr:MFS transporter [Desulfocapsaceae bacterium]